MLVLDDFDRAVRLTKCDRELRYFPQTTTKETAMAKKNSGTAKRQIHESGGEALEAAQAKKAGNNFQWHFGRITSLGSYSVAGGRSVSIAWEGGGSTSQQGDITDDQWEIFKIAFTTTGRIAILSELQGEEALYDYRFLEAVR